MTVSVFVKRGKAGDAQTQIALFTFRSKSWRASNTCTPSSLISERLLNEVHVAVYPDGVWRTEVDGTFFCGEPVLRMIGQICVLLQIILHSTSPKVQQRYVLIDTAIQSPGISHGHINPHVNIDYYLFSPQNPIRYAVYFWFIWSVPPINFLHLDDVGTVDGDTFLYLAGVLAEHQATLLSFQRTKIDSSSTFFDEAIHPLCFFL